MRKRERKRGGKKIGNSVGVNGVGGVSRLNYRFISFASPLRPAGAHQKNLDHFFFSQLSFCLFFCLSFCLSVFPPLFSFILETRKKIYFFFLSIAAAVAAAAADFAL